MMTFASEMVVVDLETTGLKSNRHGILECCAIHPASGMDRVWRVDPGDCEAEPEALVVNGLTCASWPGQERVPLYVFLRDLMHWVRGHVPSGRVMLVGRNPQFDLRMLRKAAKRALAGMERALFDSIWHHRALDTHSVVLALAMARGWSIDVERIDELYRHVGLEREARPHTAEGGATHCLAGLVRLVQAIGPAAEAEVAR